jgi:2-dehydropantoate 2-reductase
VLVIGAGALGSVYGASLARAGLPVTLLGREPHARAVRDRGGLTVSEASGESWNVHLDAEWRAEAVGDHDVVVLLTKSHDSRAALAALEHLRGNVRVAVSLQNGVQKDRILADWCGAERVIGGMSMVGATLEAPGVVQRSLAGATYLGELPTGLSDRCRWFVQRLEAGGMKAIHCPAMLAADLAALERLSAAAAR